MSNQKPNIYLFTGEDDFSLRQKVQVWKAEFAKKYSGTSIVVLSGENLSETELINKFEDILTPSLFSNKKLIIAQNVFPTRASQVQLIEALEKVVQTLPKDYFLVFWQETLDKRLGFTKNLIKEVNVMEFHLPHGRELDAWILKEAKKLGMSMDEASANVLAVTVGRDLFEEKRFGGRVVERKEAFNLWQVYSELSKLSAHASHISSNEIKELVVAKVPENVFALSDQILNQNKKAALAVLENLMSDDPADEKSQAIKLLGLISEQVRSLLVVNILQKQNLNQSQIADTLGWSSGRVFIMLKHAGKVELTKLKLLLARLLAADSVIKSSDSNPKLLLDLLIIK